MKRIVLLGPPGAGKGTQAVLLSKEKKLAHISTGDIMRAAVAQKSELGKKVSGYLDSGSLVPDALVIDLIRERLSQKDCASGFLLDGFPRTLDQAKGLTELLKKLGKPLTGVYLLKVPEDVLIKRITSRGASGSGRSDDTEEVASKRQLVYWEHTAPVIEYYRGQSHGVIEIDGLGTVEEVQNRLLSAVTPQGPLWGLLDGPK